MTSNTTRRLMELLGYKSLYPPQEEAIRRGADRGASLLVATPTASGKTFIGMAAIASALSRGGGRAFYLAPLRSVAGEKYQELRVLERLGISVGISIGDRNVRPGARVLVSTYEKLDSMLRGSPSLLDSVSVVIVDEIHYISDPKRGVVLEGLLARILERPSRPQIIGLSATVPNAEEIAEWLGAGLIYSEWRPVPLREAVLKSYRLWYPREGVEEELERVTGHEYLDVAIRVSRGGGQALVFSQSRRRVAQLAKRSARHSKHLTYDERVARRASEDILDTEGPLALREELAALLRRGVAFHHAGLSGEQRRIIEEAFRSGGVAVLHATPTLAAGVNLPARLVIVEEYYRFEEGMRRPIAIYEYKQFAGRAGRPGYDREGMSVIVASRSDSPEEVAETYILGDPEPVSSKLAGRRGLRHVLLGLLSAEAASRERVERFLGATLYARQSGTSRIGLLAERALGDLVSWGLASSDGELYAATPLGVEVARQYLDPESVPVMRDVVSRSGEIDDHVLLYMIASMPDMPTLPAGRREADRLLDIVIERYPSLIEVLDDYGPPEARRVKTTILLDMWIHEEPEDLIHSELGAGPGDVRSIVETASWIAGALARIAPLAGNAELEQPLRLLEARIRHGVKPELLPLVAIPGVGRVRARRLYSAGYKSLLDLARARPEELLRVPGLGPATVRQILEYLGRREEASRLKGAGRGRGLEAFF